MNSSSTTSEVLKFAEAGIIGRKRLDLIWKMGRKKVTSLVTFFYSGIDRVVSGLNPNCPGTNTGRTP